MKISVLIAVYNTHPDLLIQAYTSLKSQTFPADQIIFVDDGSTRNETINALSSFIFSEGPRKVTLSRYPDNKGMAHALNHGHSLCVNEWIAMMGSDDISYTDRFEKQAKFILDHPDTHVLGTGLTAFKDGTPIENSTKIFSKTHPAEIKSLPQSSWICNHGTAIYHKSVIDKCCYDPSFRRGSDVKFFRDIFNQGFKIRNIPDILYAYRRY